MIVAVVGQHAAQLRLAPTAAGGCDQAQQVLQRLAQQRWQEQSPAVGVQLEGEHLAQGVLRKVLQGQAQAGRPMGRDQLAQLVRQGPGHGLPLALLAGEGHGPHLPIRLHGIAQGQGFHRQAEVQADGRQQRQGLSG